MFVSLPILVSVRNSSFSSPTSKNFSEDFHIKVPKQANFDIIKDKIYEIMPELKFLPITVSFVFTGKKT